MATRNNKISYSKITRREILFFSIFTILMVSGVIIFSIRDIENGQLIKPILHLLLAAFLLFLVFFLYRKRNQAKASSQADQSQYELSLQERFSVQSVSQEEYSPEQKKIPLVAKVVLGFFLLLLVGLGLFVFAIHCKSQSYSTIEILILALIIGSFAVLFYFMTLANPMFMKKNTKGDLGIRRLSVFEQFIAVVAIIGICAGVALWYLY